jgi:glycosyltransferase involved in cell wall biosynthesis
VTSKAESAATPLVSVVVPVFEPGRWIEPLIASLLAQTLPPADRELVFVDDGSRDGTGRRLDQLAAEHPDVRVLHIPNSGWPGTPRNVGLDAARGEFVFFADHDDWLEPDALARMHAATVEHGADIVIGKLVGHGGRRTPHLSRIDRHGLDASDAPLGLLTPHKLFRRALLERHGIRFPEGEQRLEDHLFTVRAYFAAERISVLVSHPVYHWMRRADGDNASHRRPAPDAHFAAIRELLTIVDAHTDPGPVRDRYHLHWYRGKVLKRLGQLSGHQSDPDYRAQVYAAARSLIEERFPERLDEALAFNFRLRARLVRRDDPDALGRLAAFESGLRARARVVRARSEHGTLVVAVTGRLWRQGRRAIVVARHGARLVWESPDELRGAFADDERDVTHGLAGRVGVVLRSEQDDTEWAITTRTTTHLPAAVDRKPVFPRLTGHVSIDPATAAAGAALPPGRYGVRVTLSIAGFTAETEARVGESRFTITVTPDGRAIPSEHVGDAARTPSPLERLRAFISRRRERQAASGTARPPISVASRRVTDR